MISEISKRDIIDVLTEGLYNREFFYFGRLSETKFQNRIVNLNELSSNDSRFNNMAEDIWQHTENNDDWDIDWVFYDERLNLLHNDNLFTNFIIQVFHPIVRDDRCDWKKYLIKINDILIYDQLQLIANDEYSGRLIYTLTSIQQMRNEMMALL